MRKFGWPVLAKRTQQAHSDPRSSEWARIICLLHAVVGIPGSLGLADHQDLADVIGVVFRNA